MLAHLEAVAQWGGKQPGAGGGPDQRERPKLHVYRSGVDALTQGQIYAEILHCRIEELLDRLGQAVDFVDKQHRAFLGVGQIGHDILWCGHGRPAGDLQADAKIVGDADGERCFA